MKHELSLANEFGTHLADGARAAAFRVARIEPYVNLCDEVLLDFSGVRHANSSFINALIAGVIEQHGQEAIRTLSFKGCTPVIQVLIEGAIELGLRKTRSNVDA